MTSTRPRPPRAAITGIGSTAFGVFPGEDAYSLGSTALRTAMRESGVEAGDIDGLIVCRIPDYQRFGELHGINPQFAVNLPGQGRMAGIALQMACQAIAAGSVNTVALVYGNDGRTAGMKYGGEGDGYGSGGAGLWFPYGMTSPGAVHAMMFNRYEHEYGKAGDALAKVAVTCRQHAVLNPGAVMKKAYTTEEYYASKFIAAPLRLFDYCLINDGGIALIVTRADRAKDAPTKPVYVAGVSTATQLAESTFAPEDNWYSGMRRAAAAIEAQSGVAPKDTDATMIYDNFTPTVLFSMEGFGICGRGEAADYVRSADLGLTGRQPLNTSGGHLSESYMQGWGMFTEAVRQIRGECGARQLKKADNILYTCASPICSGAIFSSEAA
jgi:acetyl-CoA acetyltransferase